jgi:ubiquitin fusion degradation protein 1
MAMYNMLQRGGRGAAMKRFDEYYRCYPTVMLPGPDRNHLNFGGKIILPPSALEKLTRLHITYPMLFELYNGQTEKTTHAGVLEFVAEEGKVYLPNWVCVTPKL